MAIITGTQGVVMKGSHQEELMKTDEAALALGVSLGWLEKLVDGGVLRTVEVDGEVRVRAKDVRAYAEAREHYRRERLAQAGAAASEGDEDEGEQQEG
jgi:excisionase family DNA binding protein